MNTFSFFDWFRPRPRKVNINDLQATESRLMSAISTFAAKQQAFNARLDTAITGLTGDIASLNAKIEELQNSPGEISPEDQALLDELELAGDAIATKLQALDDTTPPVAPVPPVTPPEA